MSEVVCFGEVLWDLLPQGRFLGGAPLNVAYHLRRLGHAPRLVSAVGSGELGTEALARIERAGLATDAIRRHDTLPTGSVEVRLDAQGQATYQIHRPVAWDEIATLPAAGGTSAAALVFGSLALRSMANRQTLRAWLRASSGLKVCDLNLRPPFDAVGELTEFIQGCALLKVNGDEARTLAPTELKEAGVERHAEHLAMKYACTMVCVTLGGDGAFLWREGRSYRAASPAVQVKDTIGAGDAFTAALLDGILRSGENADWEKLLTRACALGAFVASCAGAQPEYELKDVPGLGSG